MKQEFLKHKIAYSILMLGLLIIALLFFALWPSKLWQRVVALLLTLFYFAWGIATHIKTAQITRAVILEYLAVASLAGLLLFLVTL